jgi:thioredoxin reductase (NADPH)
MSEKIYDMVIIGAGVTGLTAAIYASRAGLNLLLIEQGAPGGQILNTYEVDNYTGISDVSGFELAQKFKNHAEALGVKPLLAAVTEIDTTEKIKKVITSKGTYETKTVVMATGGKWSELGLASEQKYKGRGVSYCATCDGAFFKNKITVVNGGGDVAVEDAIYLARFAKKVYLVHRRDTLRAQKVLQDNLFKTENIEIIWDSEIEEILGDALVTGVKLKNKKTGETSELKTDGVFIAIGTTANSELVADKVDCDSKGNIIADESGVTSLPGLFAAGDVRTKAVKQIITGASDGANVVYSVEQYILRNF